MLGSIRRVSVALAEAFYREVAAHRANQNIRACVGLLAGEIDAFLSLAASTARPATAVVAALLLGAVRHADALSAHACVLVTTRADGAVLGVGVPAAGDGIAGIGGAGFVVVTVDSHVGDDAGYRVAGVRGAGVVVVGVDRGVDAIPIGA